MWTVALAFLIGLCSIHSLAQLPAFAAIAALVVAGGLAVALSRSLILAALLAGVTWGWLHAEAKLAGDLPTSLEGRDLLVSGYIASLPPAGGAHAPREDAEFVLDVVQAACAAGVPARIRLTWYHAPQALWPGERWQLLVRLKRRNGFANPGGFDFEGHLFRQGIGASGYVREDARNRRLAAASHLYPVTQVRALIAQRLQQAVPDSPVLGIFQGLAIGETQLMTAQQWRVLAATGTTHLMAISGLHISMIAALAAWLGGGIVRLRCAQARGWAAMQGQVIAGCGAAIVYSLLAGLSIPTQRTLIMLCIYFAARWWRCELDFAHSLGLALCVILIIDPFAPLAAGTWLSFGAVAVILAAVTGRLQTPGVLGSFARVQGAITIGLVPVLLAQFGGLSLVAPLANVLAVPLFTLFVVPAVLLGTLAALIHPGAGAWILSPTATVLDAAWPVLEWLANQPLAYWHLPPPSPLSLAAMGVGVALWIVPGIWPTRLAGLLLCIPALVNRPPGPAAGEFELTLLDVGQGLAVVVRTHAHVLVYDAGPRFASGRDAAEFAILPYLRSQGVRRLDALIISHGDLDHYGGMQSLASAFEVRWMLAGPTVQGPLGAVRCRRGQSWDWDGVRFEILHPADGAQERDNDSSCVLRVAAAAGSALLPGDVESSAEAELVRGGLARTDVVVVPHHGSPTSSTAEFVTATSPAYALIAAGYRNRWRFPAPQVLQRWQQGGARTLLTADSGAIEISFRSGDPPRVRQYRSTHRRYWHRWDGPERSALTGSAPW